MVLTDLNSDPKPKKRKLESESESTGPDPKVRNIDSQIEKLSVDNDSGDGFDDDSDDDLFDSQAQIILSQSAVRSKYKLSNDIIQGKAIVKEILGDSIILECTNGDGAPEQNAKYYEIKSRPEWVFEIGDYIHSPPEFGTIPVLHSDTLLSCTNIAIAATCPRRAILTDRFRDAGWGSDPSSYRMVLGNYLHTLFQSSLEDAMKKRKITPIYLKAGISGRVRPSDIDRSRAYRRPLSPKRNNLNRWYEKIFRILFHVVALLKILKNLEKIIMQLSPI